MRQISDLLGARRARRRLSFVAVTGVAALALSACGGGSGFDEDEGGESGGGDGPITVLIGSSGDPETKAVEKAVAAWADEEGVEAKVQVASDLNQELAQGFSGGQPPDVFYLSTDNFASYAGNGSLEPYAADLATADAFFPTLREAFTYEDEFWCAPKDFSTLALVINNRLWKQAGLTEDDVPTTWDELRTVAERLTKGDTVGLVYGAEVQRVGVFLEQNGGGLTNEEGTEATADSPENVEALTFVQEMMQDGVAAYAVDVGAGWGGEAFGKELGAMTIEGNWITGAMENDFPDVDYQVVALPAGTEEATIQYTNCWGVAADSDNVDGAVSLVEHLTTPEQQMAFADAFGVMPSVEEVAGDWKEQYPELAPFIDGAETAKNLPAAEGSADVLADMNAQLLTLKDSDPQQILEGVQENLEPVLSN